MPGWYLSLLLLLLAWNWAAKSIFVPWSPAQFSPFLLLSLPCSPCQPKSSLFCVTSYPGTNHFKSFKPSGIVTRSHRWGGFYDGRECFLAPALICQNGLAVGSRRLGNLEIGGKLPDLCRVDPSFLKSNPIGCVYQLLKPRDGVLQGRWDIKCSALALVLISTAFTSLASVSSPWNEATLFEAPRGLSSMGLAPVHPGDVHLGNFSLCVAFI